MTDFEIRALSKRESLFGDLMLVSPTDQLWKNFEPCALPSIVPDSVLKIIKNFKFYEDDILLTGYLRSGTTIMAEMLWLLAHNFDFEKATSLITDDRVAGLE